jgi:RNase P/RNase MRP subunit POP5
MRYKRRYVCVQLMSPSFTAQSLKFKISEINEDFLETLEQCYGDYGMASMEPSFSIVLFNTNTNLMILRTSKRFYTQFHAMLAFKKKLKNIDLIFKVLHASGSLKKCRKFLIDYSTKKLFYMNSPRLQPVEQK